MKQSPGYHSSRSGSAPVLGSRSLAGVSAAERIEAGDVVSSASLGRPDPARPLDHETSRAGAAPPSPGEPPAPIVPFERWRLDHRRNRHIVTAFKPSVSVGGVKAGAGPLVSLREEPRPHVSRFIVCEILGNGHTVEWGGDWPLWLLVLEGDHTGAKFPVEASAFDRWAADYIAACGVRVLGDWRAEAIRDGADVEPWPGKNAGNPKPSYLSLAANPDLMAALRAAGAL